MGTLFGTAILPGIGTVFGAILGEHISTYARDRMEPEEDRWFYWKKLINQEPLSKTEISMQDFEKYEKENITYHHGRTNYTINYFI